MAMVTLFFAMLGGWNDGVASACLALSQRGSFSYLLSGAFHLTFYIASPLLAFNVYTAFSIDVFCHLKDGSADGETVNPFIRSLSTDYQAELAGRGLCLQIT